MKSPTPLKTLSRTKKIFHIGAVLVYYLKDGATKQRHLNVLMETTDGNITKEHLNKINLLSLSRLKAENDVNQEQVVDLVILNIAPLGLMTDATFHNTPATNQALAS